MPQLPRNPLPEQQGQQIAALLAPLGAMTRRRWLRGALAFTAATGAAYCAPVRREEMSKELVSLTPGEFSLFQKVAAIFLPVEKWGMKPTAQTPLFKNIDTLFKHIPAKVRGDLGIGLRLFQYGPIVMGWHFTRFENLSHADALAYCEKWQNGNLVQRGVFGVLKQIVFMSYWREPATWSAIGYEGPVSKRFGLIRLGNAPLPTTVP